MNMDKERIAELREKCKAAQAGYFKDILRFTGDDWQDLLLLLDECEKTRAGGKVLTGYLGDHFKKVMEEAEREEVSHRCDQRDAALESVGLLTKENERLRGEWDLQHGLYEHWKARAETAKAELEKARPLLKVINKLDVESIRLVLDMKVVGVTWTAELALEAIVAYLERKGEGKE